MKKYDAVIIGFGKGGKTLAAEPGRPRSERRHDRTFGQNVRGNLHQHRLYTDQGADPQCRLAAASHPLTFEQRRAYYRKAVAEKRALVDLLRDKNYHKLADDPRIDVYTGEGRFLSPESVEVKTAEGVVQLGGKHVVINTGAETALPPIPGIAESKRIYISTSIMELDELPRRLAVVGGGYIGLEFASMYASFGSEVTVLEGFPELIPREDRDIAQAVREVLEKRGIAFRLNVKVESFRDTVDGVASPSRRTGPPRASKPTPYCWPRAANRPPRG